MGLLDYIKKSAYTSLLSLAIIFSFSVNVPVATASGVGIAEKPSQIRDIQIVNKVDRDGDGKLSDFDVKLTVGTERFKFPSKKFRKIKKGVAKGIGTFTGLPAGLLSSLTYKATMAPEYCVAATIQDNKPIPLTKDWWLPNDSRDTQVNNITVSKNKFLDLNSERDSLGSQIESGSVQKVNTLEVKTHYKAVEESGIKPPTGKVTVNNPTDEMKRALNHPCGVSSLTELYIINSGDGLKLEPPKQDKKGRVRFLSKTDGVELFADGKSLGTTPLAADFAVDVGQVKLKAKKDGYKTKVKQVKLNPTDSAKQVVRVNVEKIKKPILIRSNPSGASITINDGVVPYETPHKLDTWIKRSPTITISTDNGSKTFKDVEPPATINANLKEKTDYSNIPGSLNQNFNEDLIIGSKIPNFDYSNIVPPQLDFKPVGASISLSEDKVKTGEEIDFNGSESYSLLGDITTYRWSFGDGQVKIGEKVSYEYNRSGNYKAKLTVIDDKQNTTSTSKTITVQNRKPTAKFSASSYVISEGEEITFDGSSSSDVDGGVRNYRWGYGDGNTDIGAKVTHEYTRPGSHTVELTVTDNNGGVDKKSKTITVKKENELPQAKITIATDKPKVNQEVKLTGSKSTDPDGSIRSYNWLISGEEIKNGEEVTHKFKTTGDKEIKLSTVDFDGGTDEVTTTIEIYENNTNQDQKESVEEKSIFDKIIDWFYSIFS
jgi:PKD repeat protein